MCVCVCVHDKQINKTCLSRARWAFRAAGLNPVRGIIFAPFHCLWQTTAHTLHVWLTSAYFNKCLLCDHGFRLQTQHSPQLSYLVIFVQSACSNICLHARTCHEMLNLKELNLAVTKTEYCITPPGQEDVGSPYTALTVWTCHVQTTHFIRRRN